MADVAGLVEEMRRYYSARAPWHDQYMSYTGNAAMEEVLAPVVSLVGQVIWSGVVLEVACGTGNWTQVLARRANEVIATDISEEALSVARSKDYPGCTVMFRQVDAYDLSSLPRRFTGAFAADWWSHVPRSLLPAFLDGLHGRLLEGARVVFIDVLPQEHPDLVPYRHDKEGNGICRRALPDGNQFDVVKNFPTKEELLDAIGGRGEAPEYADWPGLRRWLLTYRAKSVHTAR